MKQQWIFGLALTLLTGLAACTKEEVVEPAVNQEPVESPYIQGEVLVKFSAEVAECLEQPGVAENLTRSGSLALDEVLARVGSYRLERVFPADKRHEARTRQEGLHQWYVVRFGDDHSAEEVAAALAPLGEVQRVEPNRTVKRAYRGKATPLRQEKLTAMTTRAAAGEDPLRDLQWHLINRGDMFTTGEVIKSVKDADVQCEKAWERTMGSPEVVVAILDEGIFVEHPDLKANMWVNEDEVERSKEDNDGNGYAGDIHGYNFVNDSGVITWNDAADSGHGSHVAGVIAALNNNGQGISSIAGGDGSEGSGVKIMACQIFSGNISTGLLSVVRAMKYAADNGAVVLQCSWGYVSGAANIYDWGEAGYATDEAWMTGSPIEKEALDYFTHCAGSINGPVDGGIAVFAAGNESAPMAGYPGAYEDYISVAATAADFTPAVYTNFGPGTSISAPGGDQDYYYDYVDEEHNYGELGCILSLLPYHISESGYGYMEGTSMACPHVSGVLALGISYAAQLRRHFTAEELKQMLYDTAVPLDGYCVGKKGYCRYVADVGPIQPMQLNLGDYVGKMGAGQIHAENFLQAIAGGGVEMRFPNLLLSVGEKVALLPARYFVEGDELTYLCTLDDLSVAEVTQQGDKLLFTALKSGSTRGVVKASDGTQHEFTLTVRQSTGAGWL